MKSGGSEPFSSHGGHQNWDELHSARNRDSYFNGNSPLNTEYGNGAYSYGEISYIGTSYLPAIGLIFCGTLQATWLIIDLQQQLLLAQNQ